MVDRPILPPGQPSRGPCAKMHTGSQKACNLLPEFEIRLPNPARLPEFCLVASRARAPPNLPHPDSWTTRSTFHLHLHSMILPGRPVAPNRLNLGGRSATHSSQKRPLHRQINCRGHPKCRDSLLTSGVLYRLRASSSASKAAGQLSSCPLHASSVLNPECESRSRVPPSRGLNSTSITVSSP